MKKHLPRMILALVLTCLMMIPFAGCTSATSTQPAQSASASAQGTEAASTETPAPTFSASEPVYIEWWLNNQKGITWEKDGPVSKWFVEKTGVGIYSPLVIWDGGEGYFTKLQTRIATGDLPDVFIPVKGVETSLINEGILWDLTEYLPKYAPNIWNRIPESVWNLVKANDPTGKGGIYYIPNTTLYNSYGTFIRKDWLDKLSLAIPTTQQEYVDVLKALRDNDPNGNAQKDELPTIGREFGRWMDHLFFMYDVAMYEGYPQFDVYDGQLTYSAVTPNMKAAIEFIHGLYEDKLLDNNTFLNKANDLWASVTSDKVGSWYHIPYGLDGLTLFDLKPVAPKADVVVLSKIAAPGYGGAITIKQSGDPLYAFAKKDEKTLIAALTLMNWLQDEKNMEDVMLGVPDYHWKLQDGKKVKVNLDENTSEHIVPKLIQTADDLILESKMNIEVAETDADKDNLNQRIRAIQDAQKGQSRVMASDGMPASVFDGYPDIQSHKLYQEYMTKIIIGEMPIEKFDEFVTRWYAEGGQAVTDKARAWYAATHK